MLTYSWINQPHEVQLQKLLEVFLKAFLSQGRTSENKLRDYFNHKIMTKLTSEPLLHIAAWDHQIAGFALFEEWNKQESCMYLAEMSIDPKFHRQGIGKALAFSILEKAPETKQIVLVTEEANTNAQGFYNHIGFKRSDFVHPDYPNNFMGYTYYPDL